MPARRVAALALALLAAACSNPQSLCYAPGQYYYAPGTEFETMSRVCGVPKRRVPALLAEQGNVWPSPPDRVPTMLDVQHQAMAADAKGALPPLHPKPLRGGVGLCKPMPGRDGPPPGIALGLCAK
jgi:hypothetical protein